MKQSEQEWKRAAFKCAAMLCTAGFAFVFETSFVSAAEEEVRSKSPAVAAALLLQQDGTHDMAGQVVTCRAGETVGIWLKSRSSVRLTNAIVEGCDIGIVVTGRGHRVGPGDLTLEMAQGPAAHLNNVQVRAHTIGIFVSGNGGLISNNIVGGASYGIVVTGDENTVIGNESNDNVHDGFLITGDDNLLEGNTARRNRGVGIHVATMVPMVRDARPRLLSGARRFFFRDRRFIPFIQDQGLGNVIRGNTALENELDLAEFADCANPPEPPLENEWISNTFETRRPQCID